MPYTDSDEVRERLDRIEMRLAALERLPPILPPLPGPQQNGLMDWLETNPVIGGALLLGLVILVVKIFV